MMTTATVRILVEDRDSKELHWYASYECDAAKLDISVQPPAVNVVSKDADNLLTTFNTTVSLIDLACELYNTYIKSSGGLNFRGEPCPVWNALPGEIRKHWIEVARRATQLGPLYATPSQLIGNALASAVGEFDTTDIDAIDLDSGEG